MNYIDGPLEEYHSIQEETMVIDWVNSLDIASCTLVDDIHDLKSGCVVADIISFLFNQPLPPIQRQISSRQDAIKNWQVLLSSLPSQMPNHIKTRPEDFLDDSSKLINLLNYLISLQKPSRKNSSGSKPTECVTPDREEPIQQETPNRIPERSSYEPRPIAETLKESLVDWLEGLHIIRKDSNVLALVPNICRTGVLFCDLVNKLQSRSEVIRGIERNPKNRTQALANVNKVLEHLRAQPKMNSRYLWSSKEIVDGNENVAWGLLEDIKSTMQDPRPKVQNPPVMSPNVSMPVLRPAIVAPAPAGKVQVKIQQKPVICKMPPREKSKSLRCYSSTMKKFTCKSSSTLATPKVSRPPSRSFNSEKLPLLSITGEMKKSVLNWIDCLGIDYEASSNPYSDILKNGILACELMRILENENLRINLYPKSPAQVFENFERALALFRSRRQELPGGLISSAEHMVDNVDQVYTFLYTLMSAYPKAGPIDYPNSLLPYGAVGIRKLEFVVVSWIDSLNILQPSPELFSELVPELTKGVLLCVVVSAVTSCKICSLVPEPKTEQSALNNIRKALEVLRKLPKMSQKFTWSEREIFKGNNSVLLGLLEDLLRWTDGLAARKAGNEYHKDGPYLRPVESRQEESFDANFGSLHSQIVEVGDNEKFVSWLCQIGADFPRSIDFNADHLPEFTTGVLLCNIVMKLEGIRIPGIEKEPRTRIEAVGNINKALLVLKKKEGFEKELLGCVDDVFLGNGEVIRRVLKEIMRVYKDKKGC